MATLEDVAKCAGVSTSTVSRAFTSPDRINSKTKEKIFEAAVRVQYKPLRSHTFFDASEDIVETRRDSIGFHYFAMASDDVLSTNPFYSRILSGALATASQAGLQVILSSSVGRTGADPGEIHGPIAQMPDAMILAGHASPEIISQVSGNVPHSVLVDAVDEKGSLDCVVSDNIGGSIAVTEYLIGLGHRRIGFTLCNGTDPSFRERLDGYLHALYWAGIEFDTSLIVKPLSAVPLSTDEQMQSLVTMLSRPDRPTAIIGASDDHAYWVYRACASLGLSIPADVSVVGFDDVAYSARMTPAMTTVHVDAEGMGAIAVARILEQSNLRRVDNRGHLAVRMMTATRIVERDSCAPVASLTY
ncbi:MAG: LacI family DNA-binding transcriptional regulator [Capsulimonadaceae bacterium]|nr:LacI family DNA-binding transcriptional regulator [Capsulimonadaceae bacterium]